MSYLGMQNRQNENLSLNRFGGPVVHRQKNPPNWAEWAVHAD